VRHYPHVLQFCVHTGLHLQVAAEKALELHQRELEPGHPMNVFLSNPERKKERTDIDANEREIYVAGLSKFATKGDLENLFKTVSGALSLQVFMLRFDDIFF
jgi:hypothetical protein